MRWLKKVDMVVATIHTWVWVVTIVPAGLTWISAIVEGLPASSIFLLVTGVLAFSLISAICGLHLFALASGHLTSRKEQTRIATQLKEYDDAGMHEIDTVTAASIWANSNEPGNLMRHLRFRHIKAAIRNGKIKNTRQVGGASRGPNIHTRISMNELREYFLRTGVIEDQ